MFNVMINFLMFSLVGRKLFDKKQNSLVVNNSQVIFIASLVSIMCHNVSVVSLCLSISNFRFFLCVAKTFCLDSFESTKFCWTIWNGR